eukprot:TRINITY_DN10213_c0_g1_i1.p1 TRINITY_DN10213_c0_g1~~TRINITY_DN10213_c0_g1_i1.p1  ORF type:complete len:702 (+),score=146.37 TRINITY_DN10213_c0_g1_i1:240-2108(+)
MARGLVIFAGLFGISLGFSILLAYPVLIVAAIGIVVVGAVFLVPATLRSINPGHALINGGTTVTITGSHFQSWSKQTARLCYRSAADVETVVHATAIFKSDTTLQMTVPPFPVTAVPPGASSITVTVSVSHNGGFNSSNQVPLDLYLHPELLSIDPPRVCCTGGQMVRIYCTAPLQAWGNTTGAVLVRFTTEDDGRYLVSGHCQNDHVLVSMPPIKCPAYGEVDAWVDIALDSKTFTDKRVRKITFFDSNPVIQLGKPELGTDLWELRSDGWLCDVMLRCTDDRMLKAHRVMLNARVKQFDTLLKQSQVLSPVKGTLTAGPADPEGVPLTRADKLPSADSTALVLDVRVCSAVMFYVLRWIYTGQRIRGYIATADQLRELNWIGSQWSLNELALLRMEEAQADSDGDFDANFAQIAQHLHAEWQRLDSVTSCCDVALCVADSGHVVMAHRAVLAARSPVFRCMFAPHAIWHESVTQQVVITQMRQPVADQLFRWLYTEQCEVDGDIALELLAAADRYGLRRLCAVVSRFLAVNLDPDTVVIVLLAAVQFQLSALTSICAQQVSAAMPWLRKPENVHLLQLLNHHKDALAAVSQYEKDVAAHAAEAAKTASGKAEEKKFCAVM